jgi:predicted secreted protein
MTFRNLIFFSSEAGFFLFRNLGENEGKNQMEAQMWRTFKQNFATGSCDFVVSDARRGRCGVQTPGIW